MRRLTSCLLLLPLLAGCGSLQLPRLSLPHVRPYERVGASRPEPRAAWPETLALQSAQSREADEGAAGAGLLPPRALQDSRVEFVQQRDDGPTRVVDGSALLVRKVFRERYGATLQASRSQVRDSSVNLQDIAGDSYRENRTSYGLELAAREGRGRYTLAVGRDSGDDDATRRFRIGVTQSLFRDLTRLSLGWERSSTDLERRSDPAFRAGSTGRAYEFAVTHLLMSRLELGATLEGRSATGFLGDPNRNIRFLDATGPGGIRWQPEQVPTQRSSDALALRGRYWLADRSTVGLEYRYYQDNWGMAAHTARADWVLPLGADVLLEAGLRHHRQDAASFHRDLLAARGTATGFFSRNPSLATLQSTGASLGFSWQFLKSRWHGLEGGNVVGVLEHRRTRYRDYRDARLPGNPGAEPWFKPSTTQLQLGIAMTF